MKRTVGFRVLFFFSFSLIILLLAGCGSGTYSGVVPGVQSFSPADGTLYVSPHAVISITFDGPVLPASVNSSSIRVMNSAGVVAGRVEYDENTFTATFTPDYQYGLGVLHTIRVKGICSMQGYASETEVTSDFTVSDGSWGTGRKIDGNLSLFPQIAFDASGNGIMVCTHISVEDSSVKLRYSSYEFGGDWSEPVDLFENAIEPRLTMDSSGRALIVFTKDSLEEGVSLCSSWYEPLTGWSAPVTVNGDSVGYPFDYQLTSSLSGQAAVIWVEDMGSFCRTMVNDYTPGKGWGTPHTLCTTNNVTNIAAAVSGSGFITALWLEMDSGFVIKACRFDPESGEWSSPVIVSAEESEGKNYLSAAADDEGNVYCSWVQEKSFNVVMFNHYSPESGWGSSEMISSPDRDVSSHSMSFNSSGNGVITFFQVDDEGKTCLHTFRYSPDASWVDTGIAIRETLPVFYTIITATDSFGNAHASYLILELRGHELRFIQKAVRYTPEQGWFYAGDIYCSPFSDSDGIQGLPLFVSLATDTFGNAGAAFMLVDLNDGDITTWINMFR